MNLRSTSSCERHKQQDPQCPNTDRLVRLTNNPLAAEMTMYGISGDTISTAGIPGTDIDRGPVVPVVVSSSITFQAPSATRALEDSLHISLSDASSLADGKPAASDPSSSVQHGETLSPIQELDVDVKGGRTTPEPQSDTRSRMEYQERYYSDFPMAVKSVERLKLPPFEKKETYRSWYAILLRRLSDHPDTASAIVVREHNGRLVRRWSPSVSHSVNNQIFDALDECLPTRIWSLVQTTDALLNTDGLAIIKRLHHEFSWTLTCPMKREELK